ncbi:hypothetical protein F0562_014540 [Nyssa sinensis]|uniref:Uncharacterized protein n=1 Tax=Nyssa sinensis TaxID=561372 RepID=A0A5J4ZQW9_9ASTE|nr:hypothetical protein F0562_014540 [Nyssa sinensis]
MGGTATDGDGWWKLEVTVATGAVAAERGDVGAGDGSGFGEGDGSVGDDGGEGWCAMVAVRWWLGRWRCGRAEVVMEDDGGTVLVSFPDFPENDEYHSGLPATLTDLYIEGLENLESLSSKGLENLTSLKEHHISKCAKLQPLPKDGLLAMLSRLEIEDCPLLKTKVFEG